MLKVSCDRCGRDTAVSVCWADGTETRRCVLRHLSTVAGTINPPKKKGRGRRKS